MTVSPQSPGRGSSVAGWIVLTGVVVFALSALLVLRARGEKPTAPVREWSAYREPGDVVTIAPADIEPIYETALRFYRPPRNQFRRLEVQLLPATPGDSTSHMLSRPLAELLVARLGDRFALAGSAVHQELGAELRVSSIYASSTDRVRVIVGCRMIWPGDVSTDNGAQAFEIVRTAKGWRIADRGGVGTPQ
jgi:hypothetical protein